MITQKIISNKINETTVDKTSNYPLIKTTRKEFSYITKSSSKLNLLRGYS